MKIAKIIGKILLRILFTVAGLVFGMCLYVFYSWYSYNPVGLVKPFDMAKHRAEAWQHRFAFINLKTNEPFTVSEIKEKVIFVNFWATWCRPCLEEMPSIEKLQKRFEGKSIRFVVASSEEVEKVKKFKKIQQWNLPYYTFNDEQIPTPFAHNGLPSTFLVVNGEVIYHYIGSKDWNSPEAVSIIEDCLAKN
jgi:thiol-disulfide isomerase/thioredoxin